MLLSPLRLARGAAANYATAAAIVLTTAAAPMPIARTTTNANAHGSANFSSDAGGPDYSRNSFNSSSSARRRARSANSRTGRTELTTTLVQQHQRFFQQPVCPQPCLAPCAGLLKRGRWLARCALHEAPL
jgi:hypothetical protein